MTRNFSRFLVCLWHNFLRFLNCPPYLIQSVYEISRFTFKAYNLSFLSVILKNRNIVASEDWFWKREAFILCSLQSIFHNKRSKCQKSFNKKRLNSILNSISRDIPVCFKSKCFVRRFKGLLQLMFQWQNTEL